MLTPDLHRLPLLQLRLARSALHKHTSPTPPHPLPKPRTSRRQCRLLPCPAPLPNPSVQNPRPPGALQKKREATYWVRSRRAGSLGGPWGGQRGRGDKKAEQVFCFFFFLHPSQGGVSAGRGSPQGHFPGTTRAQVPSPLPQSAPSPSFPQTGRQGNRVMGRRLTSPFLEKPGPLTSEGDGHLGNPSRTGDHWGAEGLTNPTSPHL